MHTSHKLSEALLCSSWHPCYFAAVCVVSFYASHKSSVTIQENSKMSYPYAWKPASLSLSSHYQHYWHITQGEQPPVTTPATTAFLPSPLPCTFFPAPHCLMVWISFKCCLPGPASEREHQSWDRGFSSGSTACSETLLNHWTVLNKHL